MITFMNLKRDSSKAKKLIRKTMITCQALESTQTCELSRGSITRFQKHVVSVFTPFKNVAAKKHLNILNAALDGSCAVLGVLIVPSDIRELLVSLCLTFIIRLLLSLESF